MKTLTITIILLISISIKTFSQFENIGKFGVKFSPGISWMQSQSDKNEFNALKFNYNYGLSSELFLSDNYTFVTGLEVSNIRGKMKFLDTDYKRTYKLSYASLPIALKMKTKEINNTRYYAKFGIDTNMLIKATSDDESPQGNRVNVNIYDEVKLFRLDMNIGLGLELKVLESSNIDLGINYNNGFFNALNKQNEISNTYYKANSSYINMSFGFIF